MTPPAPLPAAQKPAPKAPARPTGGDSEFQHKDTTRETVETVVFVVVLVLLLRTFVAEAFVIPTGSMATTLWGYQKVVECPKCRHAFPVNSSSQVEKGIAVVGCVCPNCRYDIDFAHERKENPAWHEPPWNSGDRVLVAKFIYEFGLRRPQREDVVVFKYPEKPQENHVALNYIKRLIGKPAETVGIWYGDLYIASDLTYPKREAPTSEESARERSAMYVDDPDAMEQFKADAKAPVNAADRKFQILRKAPDKILALRRLVYDNDHQAKDLGPTHTRWSYPWNDRAWMPDASDHPTKFEHASRTDDDFVWLQYQHILRHSGKPELITDFLGYNTGKPNAHQQLNWVGDLMLECNVTAKQQAGELRLELTKGVDRFQARFDVGKGTCSLWRLTPKYENGVRSWKEEAIKDRDGQPAERPTKFRQPGDFLLRFANFDEQLVVWVNKELPFGLGVPYDPPTQRGPDKENDLEAPSRIGARKGAFSVAHLKLWRDSYYTVNVEPARADADMSDQDWSDPRQWDRLRELPAKTMYVQPGHYLCLGDNSPESSDGRYWGLVPERLLLGRALVVYYPFYFSSWPFKNPVNRVGPIR